MTSLFSSFDLYFFGFPYLCIFMGMLSLTNTLWKLSSFSIILSKSNSLNSFFFSLKPKGFTKVTLSFISCVMISLILMNFLSVFSYNFALTSQFGPVFMIGISFWFSFIFFSIFQNAMGFLSHCVPEGTPIPLVSLLFVIELVSNIIRPITISVRLVANILAGHLLMILLSKLVMSYFLCVPFYILLNVVELFVALIQSYIFCTMISLYFSEIH